MLFFSKLLWNVSLLLLLCLCFYLPSTASAFISLKRQAQAASSHWSLSSTVENTSSTTASSDNSSSTNNNKKRKVAVLVCPAQFCVPQDYECLFEVLPQHVHPDIELTTCKVADLPRTEWIKVARQLPTMEFWKAELPVKRTLDWYFQAIEKGLADILAENQELLNNDSKEESFQICMIGHSIGGWIARAYLGGLSESSTAVHELALQRISSLITLGTPHYSASSSSSSTTASQVPSWADQTRGLLAAIDRAESCSPRNLVENKNIRITCVCSNGVRGNLLTTNIEEIVGATSYLPLTGKFDSVGDGIVPLDLAFLQEPAQSVILESCSISQAPIRHSHVIPTPYNLWDGYAPSIRLPEQDFPSYVTEGVVHQWAKYIQ